ncbi:MAG: hypothetical protein QOI95_1083 [Acidimicrobiaceae bacterium]
MEDLATRLRAVVNAHDDALTIAHTDFQGETRDQFDRDFASTMDTLSAFARSLEGDADELRSTIATAHYFDALSQTSPP